MTAGVEGALPTQEAMPTDAGWVANKLARLDFKTDAVLEHFRTRVENREDRGPKDYAPGGEELLNEFMKNMNRIMNQHRGYRNGDDGGDDEDRLIKRWHLGLALVSLMFLVIGAAWQLSDQMTKQIGAVQASQAAEKTATQDIRENLRDTNERVTRIEQQFYAERNRLSGTP